MLSGQQFIKQQTQEKHVRLGCDRLPLICFRLAHSGVISAKACRRSVHSVSPADREDFCDAEVEQLYGCPPRVREY